MTIKHLKPSAIYFFLLLSILVCSCTDNRYPRQLVVADSLSESNTTSAANYIDSIINHSKDMSKSERMRFLLLRAKIENRNQSLTMSSDIMKTLSEYYDDGGSGNERMLFKYIEGCCYNRSDKKQKALECFQTAAEYADTLDSNCDFKTLCRIHVQTATLFQEQISPYNAIKEWDKAHKYALAAKDTFLAVASYAYRAASFYKMGMKDSVISISENAHRLFKEHNYNNYAALQYGMIIFIYTEKGQPERAKPYFGEYEKESGLFDDNGNIKRGHEIYYYSKGLYYLYKNNTDSAEYFFRKELESASDINNRQAAYRGLYLTYKKYQIQDSITKYAELWNSMTDSAFINKSTLQLQQMAAMYDYSINKRIAEESLYEARLSKYIAMTLALVLFCSIMVFYVIYQKRKERINELNNKIALDLILINKKEIELKLLKSDNSVSNKTIKEKEEEISELQERIKTYEKKIPAKYVNKGKAFTDNPITQRFYRLANKELLSPSLDDWQEMKDFISIEVPELEAIAHKHTLKDIEYEICILVLLGFSPSEMVILTERSKSDISNIRHRLYQKITGENGSAKDFDAFIRGLL